MSSETTPYEILDTRRMPIRIALGAFVLIALLFGWFAVRWQLGNMLGTLTSPGDPNAKEISEIALNLSPKDPMTNWLVASTKKNAFTPEALTDTANAFENVAKLSPNNFQYWVELGRAREQEENSEAAEKSFKRAVELAPDYTYPHWSLGNFYLRQKRSEEAFNELKKAAESESKYRDQVFSIAWDFYEKDTARLEAIAGDSPSVKASLAKFYASKERAEDALRIWNSLSETERKENEVIAKVIAQAFFEKRIFRQSQEFVRDLGIEPEARFETVQNGGFEAPFTEAKDTYFNWRVTPTEKIEVKFDPTQKHEGKRSLRIVFSGYSEPTLYIVNQYVTVEPNAKYRLSFWVKSENLKSGGTPGLEIYNGNDDKSIVTSDALANGSNDWREVKLDFTAPANAQAVGLRTVRQFCGANCPIFGAIWYDEFKLERLK